MNNNCSKKLCTRRTAHRIVRCGLLAAVTVAASGIASAQDRDQDKKDDMTFSPRQNTTTPLPLPQGNSEYLATRGVGTQGYVCLPSGSGASWTVANARPEATLFTNVFGAAA